MAHLTRWKRNLQANLLVNSAICEALSPSVIEEECRRAGHAWRESFWSPATTLVTFLLQVLDGAKTLRSAVAVLLTQLAARGESELPSCDPSAYCQARHRLPFEAAARLLGHVTARAEGLVKASRTWLGHRVRVVDGSSVSMPDTPELQKAFPQPSAQAPGCGFPVAQLVVVFCWATGAVLDVAIDTIRPHEMTLFRSLWHVFEAGDVVLADRAYSAYVDMVRLLQRGVFCVLRLHQRRQSDFRRGRRLGKDDQLVIWDRPKWLASFGITREELEQLPETLTVRLVRIADAPRGFRSRTIVVATTLLDPAETPADEIRALYRDRWTAELNLRSLKAELGMDVLRGERADVVRKEIVMHLLAYNLIRLLMWHAAADHGRDLHRLSFTGTLHRLRAVVPLLVQHRELRTTLRLIEELLRWIASDRIPHRPGRSEPRRRKRRPKEYSLLTKPRRWYHLHGDHDAR
jgi:IS4 transposase